MTKCILIDPTNQTVVDHEIGEGIQGIYDAIKANCFDCVMLPLGDAMYVDDEGLFRKEQSFFELGGRGPFAGRALLTGTDGEGETVNVKATVELIKANIVWRPHIEVGGWTKRTETESPGWVHIKAPMPKFKPK